MTSSDLTSFVLGLGLLLEKKAPTIGDPIHRPGLNVEGQTVQVAGEVLEVYEYASDTDIQRDIRALGFQAQLWGRGSGLIPYCFQKEHMLLLYAGHHPQVIGWLTRVCGASFLRP